MAMKNKPAVAAAPITDPVTAPTTTVKKHKRKPSVHSSKAIPRVPMSHGFNPQQSATITKLMIESSVAGRTKAQNLEQFLVGVRQIASVL